MGVDQGTVQVTRPDRTLRNNMARALMEGYSEEIHWMRFALYTADIAIDVMKSYMRDDMRNTLASISGAVAKADHPIFQSWSRMVDFWLDAPNQ